MASTSAPRGGGGSGRMANSASTLCSDYQSLIVEIRRTLGTIKQVAVDLEKDKRSDLVKELEGAVVELLATSDECTHLSSAIESVGLNYQPGEQLTDFRKLLKDELNRFKSESPSVPQGNPLFRQFEEAVWNVHHAGQPMPGEEQEDIVMTSTQNNLLNVTCPMTGKPVTELESPVRSMDCKHIYEKGPIMQYIKTKKPQPQCPVAGCPKILRAERVVCDPLLPIEIDEIRAVGDVIAHPTEVEDFTELDDE